MYTAGKYGKESLLAQGTLADVVLYWGLFM